MNEIICPNCQKAFKIDESSYADMIKQVRDNQFKKELEDRLNIAKKEKESAIKLAEANIKNRLQEELVKKDRELGELKSKMSIEIAEKNSAIKLAEANVKSRLQEELSKKDTQLSELKSKIESIQLEKQLEISEAIKVIENERDNLLNDLKIKETEKKSLEILIKEKFTTKLNLKDETIKMKDDEIARLKEFKQKLSTKMVGESLEQHCEIEFNKLRPTAFKNAYFEKDNDSSGGNKGDFIYREMNDEGEEIISIMFEMKNENDETINKKKNEDFFAKLDKDRNSKNCEYAILVSLLESDNELYNSGIVDVSYRFNKMYVIRPQFFIPIITLLRNAAMNSMKYKTELTLIKNQNIDITNFEEKINTFKTGFAKNYESASTHFEKAIEEIDKSIARMQRVKQELTTSANQLRLANKKAESLTIRKLTYKNPTMKAKFNQI